MSQFGVLPLVKEKEPSEALPLVSALELQMALPLILAIESARECWDLLVLGLTGDPL